MTLRVVICGLLILILRMPPSFAVSDVEMPFMKGETMNCSQGNADCNPTHCNNGAMEYAWDFGLYGASCGDCDIGLPVIAGADGRIVYAQDYASGLDDWGQCVVADYDNDGSPDNGLHAHLDQIFVKVGEWVKQGQVLGTLGNASGRYNNAAHLHYQRQDGNNPNGWSNTTSFSDVGVPISGHHYTSLNSNIIDLRKSTSLNNSNPYGWPQSPATVCGTFGDIYWWHGFDPDYLYFADHTSKRCYVSVGANNSGGVVYDALGGARQAYYVGWENEWDQWEIMDISCGSCPNPEGTGGHGDGGPNSCLGMPITNRYEESVNHWRQDFQKGHLY